MSAGRLLKSYVWWTYERGSVPYDVMVTLILAFIFLSPIVIHYGDRPKPDLAPNEIRAIVTPGGQTAYVVPVEMAPSPKGIAPSSAELEAAIARVAGPVTVERSEPVREIGGRLVGWKVWAHR